MEQRAHIRALMEINERFDAAGAIPLTLQAARNEMMISLGLLSPLTLIVAIQLSPLGHLYSPDPSDNFLVQGSTRYQVIFVMVGILSIYHHQHYRDEPLCQNLKDWRLDSDPATASHASQVSGRLDGWEKLLAALHLKGHANPEDKPSHCRDEAGKVFAEVAECIRSTLYPDCPPFLSVEQCQYICKHGPAWIFPQNVVRRFQLGSQRDRESVLNRIPAPQRTRALVLPATLEGKVNQIAFRVTKPPYKRGRYSFRNSKHCAFLAKKNEDTPPAGVWRPWTILNPRDHGKFLPHIPLPPDMRTHRMGDVRWEQSLPFEFRTNSQGARETRSPP